MDATAVNFDPRATRDDGSCVGSLYSLSGVYEVHTVAAGEDLSSSSGGMEFDVMGTNSLVKDVKPGSLAWTDEVQVADEWAFAALGTLNQHTKRLSSLHSLEAAKRCWCEEKVIIRGVP